MNEETRALIDEWRENTYVALGFETENAHAKIHECALWKQLKAGVDQDECSLWTSFKLKMCMPKIHECSLWFGF